MADKRFFSLAGPFTLGQIAEMTGSDLSDPVAASKTVVDVAPIGEADATKLSFLDNKKYLSLFQKTSAGACFVRPDLADQAPQGTVCLKNKNPYKAYAIAAQAFYPLVSPSESRAGSAVVDRTAVIGKGVEISANVVIGKNVKIGDNCRIDPNTVIGDGVEIGNNSEIGANVTLSHAVVGSRVNIQPGCVIGSPGFGFAIDASGYLGVPQLGRVLIGDDVDIGANVAIDRGAGPDTVIGQGTRIDNLVHIAHNVKIGKYCIIAGQVRFSGSTELGDYVMIGGQAGFVGHLKIGAGSKIAAQSGIMRDIPPKSEVMGCPAVELKKFLRQSIILGRMAEKNKSEEK